MCTYVHSKPRAHGTYIVERLRLRRTEQRVAKHSFEEFADINEVLQPLPSAKMVLTSLLLSFCSTLLASLPLLP